MEAIGLETVGVFVLSPALDAFDLVVILNDGPTVVLFTSVCLTTAVVLAARQDSGVSALTL